MFRCPLSMFRKTKIVCTIGPASSNKLDELTKNGMNVARLNFSHGSHETHGEIIYKIKDLRDKTGTCVPAIALDTQGPEMRLKIVKQPNSLSEEDHIPNQNTITERYVHEEEVVTLSNGTVEADFHVNLKTLDQIMPGHKILFDDGKIQFFVLQSGNALITMRSNCSHVVKNNKSVNIPKILMDQCAPTEKDKKDILFGIEKGVDVIFLSFINNAQEIHDCKNIVIGRTKKMPLFYSKIESALALENLDEIIQASDGIMIARGDLSVEIGYSNLFNAQKRISKLCKKYNKPFIMATQMLESMCQSNYPYRSEICDIGNSVLDGADCTMLSAETATGQYPIKSLTVMGELVLAAEKYENELYEQSLSKSYQHPIGHVMNQIAPEFHSDSIKSEQRRKNGQSLIFERTGSVASYCKNIPEIVLQNYPNINNDLLKSEPEISSPDSPDIIKLVHTLRAFKNTRLLYPRSTIHVISTDGHLCAQINLFSNAIAYQTENDKLIDKIQQVAQRILQNKKSWPSE